MANHWDWVKHKAKAFWARFSTEAHRFVHSDAVSRIRVHITVGVHRLVNFLAPYAKAVWIWFQRFVNWIFAVTDHSIIRTPRAILRLSAVFIGLLLAWAMLSNIDQVVNAPGQVVASAKTQIVQAADGGVLVELRVEEGATVNQGEIIAVLEKNRVIAAYSESYSKVVALRMRVARLQAEIAERDLKIDEQIVASYPNLAETEISLFNQRRKGFLDQSLILQDIVAYAEQELKMNAPLERSGDISRVDMIRLKKSASEAKSNLYSFRNKYFQDATSELNKATEDLNAQEQILADRKQVLEHTDIIAPATGIVKSIKTTTLGGVIRQGDEILQILPTESDLVVEAKVKPSDMAFIKPGLPAKVKLDDFDYSIYGSMNGVVSYVSADALSEETKNGAMTFYKVKVNIKEQDLKNSRSSAIDIRPGMTVTVDIKTGDRSILSYLLKPIIKTVSGSLGER
jgi:adhesin transport system membrane fusion protein